MIGWKSTEAKFFKANYNFPFIHKTMECKPIRGRMAPPASSAGKSTRLGLVENVQTRIFLGQSHIPFTHRLLNVVRKERLTHLFFLPEQSRDLASSATITSIIRPTRSLSISLNKDGSVLTKIPRYTSSSCKINAGILFARVTSTDKRDQGS